MESRPTRRSITTPLAISFDLRTTIPRVQSLAQTTTTLYCNDGCEHQGGHTVPDSMTMVHTC